MSKDFSKPVTAHILPQNVKLILKNTNVIALGMYKVHTKHNQTRKPLLPQDIRKTNKRVSFSTSVIPTTSVSRLQLKSNQLEDKVMPNNSQGKKQELEDHHRIFKFSNIKTSVTASNDSLNAKTSNLVEIILFIFDSEFSKHMTGNLKLLSNFVEKFQEVAFRKSTCYVHDLKGNDLLTGSRGSDLYLITLQDTTSPNPICLIAKATSSQAWLWHHRCNISQILVTPLDDSIFCCYPDWGVTNGIRAKVIENQSVKSSASYAVNYTSFKTDSDHGRLVAPPSPDYIPGPEEPQTPPVPQDEDEREPMFIQPHDPNYVPEPMYPEYIPLEDEHVFPDEEQPLPPFFSPTAESPGYVVKSNPEEDLEEFEDDETEDGPVDYPMDGGEDGDNNNGNSSRDDADDDDEDEEEVEEHLALANSAVVVPTVEPVSPPEGTYPVIPPPSIDITTTGARITVRLQASISLPPEAEVERLLDMPTPPPSPLISLSPPFAGERLARYTAPSAHSSPPLVPSLFLPSSGCLTQTETLRIASTQALIDAVTTALPSPPLPLLPPSLYISPPVDRMDDIPESERLPRKRSCLFTLGSRYKVRESSTARPTGGQGIDYAFVSTVDAEARRQGIKEVGYGIRDTWVDPAKTVPEIAPVTMGEVNTRVIELAELHEHDTQNLYALLEDAQDSRTRISQRVTMDSQRVDLLMEDRIAHQETVLIVEEEAYASREAWAYEIGLSQVVHYELQTHHTTPVETLRLMRDMRREMGDMQAELLALREQQKRARQPGPDVIIPDHQDASRDADSHI
ncbi:hypothetical protein Tco_1533360 [Tanacetum coccineum]